MPSRSIADAGGARFPPAGHAARRPPPAPRDAAQDGCFAVRSPPVPVESGARSCRSGCRWQGASSGRRRATRSKNRSGRSGSGLFGVSPEINFQPESGRVIPASRMPFQPLPHGVPALQASPLPPDDRKASGVTGPRSCHVRVTSRPARAGTEGRRRREDVGRPGPASPKRRSRRAPWCCRRWLPSPRHDVAALAEAVAGFRSPFGHEQGAMPPDRTTQS